MNCEEFQVVNLLVVNRVSHRIHHVFLSGFLNPRGRPPLKTPDVGAALDDKQDQTLAMQSGL